MRIDLHTHSNRSDGTDSPAELVANAVDARLDVVALTDHDSTHGWVEAQSAGAQLAADGAAISVVLGMEISTRLDGKSIHLLAYNFDPSNEPLIAELQNVIDGRNGRLPLTLARLHDLGIDIETADVERWSKNAAATGRPHIADAMVEHGVVRDRSEAFDKYLMPGRPAYVDRYAAELFDAVRLVGEAGGRTVLAHPWSRGSHKVLTASTIAELKAAGLAGIEVDHNDHDAAARDALRRIAVDLDLIVTGSSDYHGAGKVGFDLGCNTTEPEQFERLMAPSLR